MGFIRFLGQNARWIGGGFLLTFFSSFGQTFFIALSAGDIRSEYGLSHGGFGTLYMVATLATIPPEAAPRRRRGWFGRRGS